MHRGVIQDIRPSGDPKETRSLLESFVSQLFYLFSSLLLLNLPLVSLYSSMLRATEELMPET